MTLFGARSEPEPRREAETPVSIVRFEEDVPNTARSPARSDAERRLALGVTILAVLALLYTLFAARIFLVPIAYALLLNFVLSPVVRVLGRVGLPRVIAAAVVVITLVAVLVTAVYALSGPAKRWVDQAPTTVSRLEGRIRTVMRPMQTVQKTAQQVAQQTSVEAGAKPREIIVQRESFSARVYGTTKRLLVSAFEVMVLLYFLLAAGDLFRQKLIRVLPNISDKKKAVRISRQIESSIASYLLTAAAVYITEGLLVTGAMFALGMPTPPLWGALVAILEFIPYFGAATFTVIISITALGTFDSVGYALLVPASFLVINLIQANLVIPIVLGYRLSLNPVAVFIGLAFWFWIWGVPGAFVAVPMLATLKILCDHIEGLKPIGEFLERDHPRERALGTTA